MSRAFLCEALATGSHAVDAFGNGVAALQAAVAAPYDLLLLDLALPRLAGDALLQRLRGDPQAASRSTPALALTADGERRRHRHLLDAGFVAVLGKPLLIDDLLAAVAGALAGRAPIGRASTPAAAGAGDWDDATALRAANGSAEIVAALRPLLLAELPRQRQRTLTALDAGDHPAAAAELHRLRAACGFCGAARLALAVDGLAAALAGGGELRAAREAFDAAADRLLRPAPVR